MAAKHRKNPRTERRTSQSKQTISACLVVYNEEAIIERCLRSLEGAVDEIIVVHDGKCADKTLILCKRYGARVFVREHIGIAEPHRPFAFSKCTSDWVLQIDADEFLSPELKKGLPALIAGDCDAYALRWPTTNGERYVDFDHKPCLFRRSKLYAYGLPQHNPCTSGRMCRSDLLLEHQPKRHSFVAGYLDKQRAWAKVHASWLWKDFSEVPLYNMTQDDWPRGVRIKRRLAFLYPFVGAAVFLKSYLLDGKFLRGRYGLRSAFIQGFYNHQLYKQIWKQRK